MVTMAYTLNDPFRALRTVLRLSGSATLLAGAALLLVPAGPAVSALQLGNGPLRLAGAALLALGVFYLLSANERTVHFATLVTCSLGNGLPAVLVVAAYLQRELALLVWPLQAAMLLLFVFWLAGAVVPLRFLNAEYQDE
jgi:hypothetical protein